MSSFSQDVYVFSLWLGYRFCSRKIFHFKTISSYTVYDENNNFYYKRTMHRGFTSMIVKIILDFQLDITVTVYGKERYYLFSCSIFIQFAIYYL